jgi:hypothetical protein
MKAGDFFMYWHFFFEKSSLGLANMPIRALADSGLCSPYIGLWILNRLLYKYEPEQLPNESRSVHEKIKAREHDFI